MNKKYAIREYLEPFFVSLMLALALTGTISSCSDAQLDKAGVYMTQAQKTMCAAQQAANMAGAAAEVIGDGKGISVAAKASVLTGMLCTWSNSEPISMPDKPPILLR